MEFAKADKEEFEDMSRRKVGAFMVSKNKINRFLQNTSHTNEDQVHNKTFDSMIDDLAKSKSHSFLDTQAQAYYKMIEGFKARNDE